MKIRQQSISRVNVFSLLLVSIILLCATVTVNAQSKSAAQKLSQKEGVADSSKVYEIANFVSAQQHGTEIFSNSRTWYSAGGLSIKAGNKALKATGHLNTWGGFGVDPGPKGTNGASITAKEFSFIVIELEGTASSLKIELYDNDYNKEELWVDLANKVLKLDLPDRIKSGNISKMQFMCAPGYVDLTIKRIYLSK